MKSRKFNRSRSLSQNLTKKYATIITMVFIVLFVGFISIYNYYIFKDIKNDFRGIYFPYIRRTQEFDKEYVLNIYDEHILSRGVLHYNDEVFKYSETTGEKIPSGKEIISTNITSRLWSVIKDKTMLITIELASEKGKRLFFVNFNIKSYLSQTSIGNIFILTMIYILGIYASGIAGLLIFGNKQAKKALKPIKDLTLLTENINERNLNLRLDIDAVEYELKDLGVTFNGMLDRIQNVYKKQRDFISDVSHELKTPISVIGGYAKMLKRWGKSDEKVLDESIDAIIAETNNMKQMTKDLLFLSKSDSNMIEYDYKDINISGIIFDIIRETSVINADQHILKNKIFDNLFIKGDPNKIKQCIRIFVENAITHTPRHTEINIVVQGEEDGVEIVISDNGPGIEKDKLGKIFNRFFRGDTARNREGGVGLGLSIAKEIVLKHKGTIEVETKEEKGTSFRIFLPSA